jgi:hypothetical protein
VCLTSVVINIIPTYFCRTCNGFIIPMCLKGFNALTLLAKCHVLVEYRPKNSFLGFHGYYECFFSGGTQGYAYP